MIPWITLIIIILLIIFGVFFYKKKKFKGMDMRGFYLLGLIFSIIGIMSDNTLMWRMGILFLILSLFYKDKWIKKRKR